MFLGRRLTALHTGSELISRLGLLRRSVQWREKFDEIFVKGREQIDNLLAQDPDLRFKEVLVSNKLVDFSFLRQLSAHRIRKVDPELLYYIVYQSKPLPSGGIAGKNDIELSESDMDILRDPKIADSLMLATLPRPAPQLPERPKFVVCLDGVIFPDNVGTIIRCAHAVGGVDAIVSTAGSCDFDGWKVLEASKGFGFNIPKAAMNTQSLAEYISKHNLLPVVGDASVGIHPKEVASSGHSGVIVIIGNEKHGPRPEILDLAVRVRIPINERMNSLNAGVAGGLLLQLAKPLVPS